MSAILVLWDIDHTLIENNGVNKEIYAYAFELLTGRHAEHPARTDGRTEPEIMRNMLRMHGIEPSSDYVARMPETLEAATLSKVTTLRERGHELPGARDVLTVLQAASEIVQSVLSGNIKPNAIASFRHSTSTDSSILRLAGMVLTTKCALTLLALRKSGPLINLPSSSIRRTQC